MAETVQEIRECYEERTVSAEYDDRYARILNERIGSLLTEIDRLEVIEMCFLYATTELAKVHARLDRAVAVCEAFGTWGSAKGTEFFIGPEWDALCGAHNTYLAGKRD